MKNTRLLLLTLPIILILLSSLPSLAHKVRIFAWEENGTIKGETKFSGGRAAKNSSIKVINAQDKQEILTTTTDGNGFFSFPIPQKAKEQSYDLEIFVNSGDGHKNSWRLNAADYLDIAKIAAPRQSAPVVKTKAVKKTVKVELNSASEEQLRRLIESALEKKLAPIKRSLAMQQEKPTSLQDILGGIGYILGLAGLTAYFKSKYNSKE